VALKNHPKLVDDADYHIKVSELVSSERPRWAGEKSFVPLGAVWEDIDKRLDKESERQKSMVQLMNQVERLANRDSLVGSKSQALRQTDWTLQSPRAFWQSHCQCLVALKTHPKLADDVDYQDSVSTLLSATFSLSMIGDGLEPLRLSWQRVEQGLDKQEKRPRYVSFGWYATSMVAMVLLAVGLVYQFHQSNNELKGDFENQLAALNQQLTAVDNKQADNLSQQLARLESKHAETAQALNNKQAETAQGLSEQLTALDNKQAKTTDELSEQLSFATNKQSEQLSAADKLSVRVTALDQKQAETAFDLSKQLEAVNNKQSEQLSAVDNKHVQTANKLSVRVTALDQKQAETAQELSEQLAALDQKQAETAQTLRTDITALDQKQAQTTNDLDKRLTAVDQKQADTIGNLSGQLASLESKHAQTAQTLRTEFTALDQKQAQTLRTEITAVDNKHVQKAGELSERLIEVDKRIGKVVRDRLKDGSFGPEMVMIPAGTFRMGDIQGGGDSDEKPVHQVSIKSFAMGRYEVTFAEYDKFAEATGEQSLQIAIGDVAIVR